MATTDRDHLVQQQPLTSTLFSWSTLLIRGNLRVKISLSLLQRLQGQEGRRKDGVFVWPSSSIHQTPQAVHDLLRLSDDHNN